MTNTAQWKQAIGGLRRASEAHAQLSGLKHCRELSLSNPIHLKIYHDGLLFLCAYPFNKAIYALAGKELKRIAEVLEKHQHNPRWQIAVNGSGLPFTALQCQYSAGIVRWLLEKFPGDIQVMTTANNNETTKLLWQTMLPGIEFFETTQGNSNIWNRVKKLSDHNRDAKALQWILQLFEQQTWNPILREILFNQLGVFINWKVQDPFFNRSFLRCPINAVYYRKQLKRKVNSISIIQAPLTKPLLLNKKNRLALIDLTRASLALYYRETDPVTFADPSEITMHDMGGGLQICLTGMQQSWRLSLESYIGFMAFKNGLPIAYGGGWIFGYRCKIGVNIYPPFRGAGSDQLFCQVMRLYYQVYNARHFVVKPYQFGKGNPEGIKSGAFWFYYKLGFRPQEEAIKKAADAEWQKLAGDSLYRTPVSILRHFASCNMQFEPVKGRTDHCDAETMSKTITRMICTDFAGNRERAGQVCMRRLAGFLNINHLPLMDTIEFKVWQNWSLLFACLPKTTGWNVIQRRRFLHLLQLKASGREITFIKALQNHRAFWLSVNELYGRG